MLAPLRFHISADGLGDFFVGPAVARNLFHVSLINLNPTLGASHNRLGL